MSSIEQQIAETKALNKELSKRVKLLREEAQLTNAFTATSGVIPEAKPVIAKEPSVRKNAKFGSKTWYLDSWKQGDRTVQQFGYLISKDPKWIQEKEANHVRVSKAEAYTRIGVLMKQ